MNGQMLQTIIEKLTKGRPEEVDRLRAIYSWMVMNVAYDCRGHHHPKQTNNSPSAVFMSRKGTYEGYANLFKTMCDMAHIKCDIVKGFAKSNPQNIGEISEKNAHMWNAVSLNNTWYFIDATWSAGFTDVKVKNFTPAFTDAWFLTEKSLFALSHFPANKKWQMLDTPINRAVFTNSPIVGPAAISNEVYPTVMRGKLRGRADTSKKIAFELDNPPLVKSVSVSHKYYDKAPVPYSIEDDILYVEVPFPKQGVYPVNIYINDALAYIYNADVGAPIYRPKPKVTPVKKEPVPIRRSISRGSG